MPRSVLRFLFKLLYHQLAWSYDLVAWLVSAGQWRHWVLTVLPYLKGPRVLELGHGPGHLLLAMASQGMVPIGLDASWQMSRLASFVVEKWGVNLVLINGYAQFMSIANAAIDQVVTTFPAEYITDPAALEEVYRVLKPGGEFYILPSAWLTDERFIFRLASLPLKISLSSNGYAKTSDRHPLVARLTTTGFETSSWIEPVLHSQVKSQVWLVRAQKPVQA